MNHSHTLSQHRPVSWWKALLASPLRIALIVLVGVVAAVVPVLVKRNSAKAEPQPAERRPASAREPNPVADRRMRARVREVDVRVVRLTVALAALSVLSTGTTVVSTIRHW